MPRDKCIAFVQKFGNPKTWEGQTRPELLWLSELEILKTYNAEVRGFLQYYSLADNLTSIGGRVLWLTTKSFLRTLADKRKTRIRTVISSMKRQVNTYVLTTFVNGQPKENPLVSSTRDIHCTQITWDIDIKPRTQIYRARTELGQRLQANQCEWCGSNQGSMEVHHVRKLKDLKGRSQWECHMIARQRKTIVMCRKCHRQLHAGRLPVKRELESQMQ